LLMKVCVCVAHVNTSVSRSREVTGIKEMNTCVNSLIVRT
jgi:hypothetical protein